jgi:ectoine hydroxylase-related dioxygenase (phytanoyl-CoA dioxygenase family)
MLTISNLQMTKLHDDGYLSVEALAPTTEIVALRKTIERLFAQKAGASEGAYGELIARDDDDHDSGPNSPQIRNVGDYAPELYKSQCFHNALGLAQQILGPQARFFSDVAIFKRPQHGSPTPWHQDEAFRDPHFSYREVTIWVALQDVDERSGCLMFIPGSHHGSVHTHRVPGPSSESLALECVEGVDQAAAVPCRLASGACSIHLPRTLHCSTPNLSEVARIGYAMTFSAPPKASKSPGEFPWLKDRIPAMQAQRRTWMRQGGWAIAAWRRLRRGDLQGWSAVRYWTSRAVKTVKRGG